MTKNAIGLIETRGLVAAVEAVDACLKAANVELISYRFTTGGLVCITVTGEVGAVKAAVEAGTVAAQKVGQVTGIHVIPRPADDTMNIVEQIQMKASLAEEPEAELVQEMDEEEEMVEEQEIVEDLSDDEEQEEDQEATALEQEIDEEEVADEEDDQKASEPTYGEDELIAAVITLRQLLEGTKEEGLLDEDKALDRYGVRALRRVFRALPVPDIEKSKISGMRKQELIDSLMDFVKKEGGNELSDDENR